jgi:hypothetical protein
MSRSGAKFWWKKELPRDIAYLIKDNSFREWKEITYKSILDKKVKIQQNELWRKRNSSEIKPALIWVFRNEDFPFSGWYIYIKTLKKDFAISFSRDGEYNQKAILKAMEIYPQGTIPIIENFEIWCENFSKSFPTKSFGGRKKQGLAICKAEIRNNRLLQIQ